MPLCGLSVQRTHTHGAPAFPRRHGADTETLFYGGGLERDGVTPKRFVKGAGVNIVVAGEKIDMNELAHAPQRGEGKGTEGEGDDGDSLGSADVNAQIVLDTPRPDAPGTMHTKMTQTDPWLSIPDKPRVLGRRHSSKKHNAQKNRKPKKKKTKKKKRKVTPPGTPKFSIARRMSVGIAPDLSLLQLRTAASSSSSDSDDSESESDSEQADSDSATDSEPATSAEEASSSDNSPATSTLTNQDDDVASDSDDSDSPSGALVSPVAAAARIRRKSLPQPKKGRQGRRGKKGHDRDDMKQRPRRRTLVSVVKATVRAENRKRRVAKVAAGQEPSSSDSDIDYKAFARACGGNVWMCLCACVCAPERASVRAVAVRACGGVGELRPSPSPVN